MELYQQLFLISALLNIPLIFPITQGTHYKCFWAILLFIIDRTIYKKIQYINETSKDYFSA